MSEIGVIMRLGTTSRVGDRVVFMLASASVLFFVRVNQVLVRLWARALGMGAGFQ
jgi:hypothetical protein